MAAGLGSSAGSGSSASGSASSQYFSLRWNNHPVNLVSVFTGLYQAESLVDVSLAAEGRHVQAHKVVLSACSEYFQSLFAANPCQHPIVILKDVAFEDLQVVVKFMYYGIVNVSADKLPGVLKTADALQIKGLEKNNELLSGYLAGTTSPRLLPLPSQQGRQPSTESLPEYLHRSRSEGGFFPHRALSAESRGYSFDSGPLDISRLKRQISPPGSPTPASSKQGSSSYARKKFRNRSDAESADTEEKPDLEANKKEESGESVGAVSEGPASEPVCGASPLADNSPSRYSSSDTEHIAKKKRAMFQARRTGSDSGSKSSDMQHSSSEGRSDKENKLMDTSLSLSRSISHSSDRDDPDTHVKDTLQVPGVHPRTLVRTVSASEVQGALSTKFKRGRFLKRQQCQEANEDTESSGAGITKSEPPSSPPSITVSSPTPTSLVKQRSQPLLPSQNYSPSCNTGSAAGSGNSSIVENPVHSPPEPAVSPPVSGAPPIGTTRQPSLDPLCGLESVPLLYSSSGPGPRLTPPAGLLRSSLPSVRVIPENEPVHEILPHQYPPPIPSPSLLYPQMPPYEQIPQPPHYQKSSLGTSSSRHRDTLLPPTTHTPPYSRHSLSADNLSSAQPQQSEQFGHCPKARDGPALSCNFCWNTTDGSGRILRRKTKYHCPECQTNLCIVPCFQQFHEALENEGMSEHH